MSISVSGGASERGFTLDRLNLAGTGLPDHLTVIVVATAGNSSVRHEMGRVSSLSPGHRTLNGLDESRPLRFRVLLREKNDPKVLASVEKLRPRDEAESESLLPMEAADLGERLWKLLVTEDGPVLQFNAKVFPSASGAENFVPFGALVLPEALRQVMKKIANEPALLDDENDPWYVWADWLRRIGAQQPPGVDEDGADTWPDEVVDRFCERFEFATRLHGDLLQGDRHA